MMTQYDAIFDPVVMTQLWSLSHKSIMMCHQHKHVILGKEEEKEEDQEPETYKIKKAPLQEGPNEFGSHNI